MSVLSLKTSRSGLQCKDKVLICALALEEQSRLTYSREELSITMWKKYPYDFGLKGYEAEYPDSHHALLLILKAIRNNKLLHRDNQYMLSVSGRSEAYKLATKYNVQIAHKGAFASVSTVPLHIQSFVERLLDSEAYHLKQQKDYSYTFLCACKFWGLEQSAKGQEVNETLTTFKALLLSAASAIQTGQTKFNNRRVVTRKEVYDLIELSNDLEVRCRKYLTLMMERK